MPIFAHLRRWCWISPLLLALLGCRKGPAPTDLGPLPAFALKDQLGQPIGSEKLRGQVWVAAFMFTRCPTICPRITTKMRKLQQDALKAMVPITLLSISVDPEFDTPPVLKAYAQRFEADLTTWSFATGDFQVIQKTAVDGFKLALDGRADAGAEDFGIVHGSHLMLVDQKLHLRGYYRTDDDAELARLLVDAKALMP